MWINTKTRKTKSPWNKGKLVGQKPPLTQQEIWSIRLRLGAADRPQDLAPFNLAIDSKLRVCDLLRVKVSDVSSGHQINSRATILQQKTKRPVRFELTARIVDGWVAGIGLDHASYGTHSKLEIPIHSFRLNIGCSFGVDTHLVHRSGAVSSLAIMIVDGTRQSPSPGQESQHCVSVTNNLDFPMIAAQISFASPFMKNVIDSSSRISLIVNVYSAMFGSPFQTIVLSMAKPVTSAPLMLLPRLCIL